MYLDLLEGKPDTYSPFRPGMTATRRYYYRNKIECIVRPNSSVVCKSDTAAVKEIKVDDLMKNKRSCTKSDKKFECVFVKVGIKLKLELSKPESRRYQY
jgi:HlyD family secretion protein